MPDLVREVVEVLDAAQLPSRLRAGAPLEFVAVRGRGHGRKAIVLVLAGGVPVLFLKTASDAGAQDLVRERTALDHVARLSGLQDGAPRALGLLRLQERHVLVLSALPGRPLLLRLRTTSLPRRAAAQGLRAARAWLETFQEATRLPETQPLPLLDLLGRYRSTGSPFSSDQEQTLDRFAVLAARFDGLELPLTARHGDFWPGNLMIGRSGTRVVDWEHFVPTASPLTDLWFLLISTAHALPGPRRSAVDGGQAFSRAFLERGWYSDLVLEVTRQHLPTLGLPVEAAEVLLLVGLLERAEPAASDVTLAPVGPAGGDWEAHARALLSAGGSQLRLA